MTETRVIEVPCPECGGTGRTWDAPDGWYGFRFEEQICDECDGEGMLEKVEDTEP